MKDQITPNEYQQLAKRTESLQLFLTPTADREFVAALSHGSWGPHLGERVIHAILGLSSEAGELADALKKHLFYGKLIDRTNLKEECGDLLWYIAILLDAIGVTMSDAMSTNIAKLQTRYPDKFTTEAALNRDLDAERKALTEP